jgi:hypothetical protein
LDLLKTERPNVGILADEGDGIGDGEVERLLGPNANEVANDHKLELEGVWDDDPGPGKVEVPMLTAFCAVQGSSCS